MDKSCDRKENNQLQQIAQKTIVLIVYLPSWPIVIVQITVHSFTHVHWIRPPDTVNRSIDLYMLNFEVLIDIFIWYTVRRCNMNTSNWIYYTSIDDYSMVNSITLLIFTSFWCNHMKGFHLIWRHLTTKDRTYAHTFQVIKIICRFLEACDLLFFAFRLIQNKIYRLQFS